MSAPDPAAERPVPTADSTPAEAVPGARLSAESAAPTGTPAEAARGSRLSAESAPPIVPTRVPWVEVGVFLVVTVGLGWLVCLPLWLSGKGLSDLTFVQLTGQALMFTPLLGTIAALIVQRRRAREPLASIPRRLGLWPLYPVGRVLGGTGLAVLATYLLVLATYLLAGAFGWMRLDLVGLSGFSAQQQALPGLEELPLGAAVAVYLVIVVVNTGATALFAFGEEVGWRGWLLTSLRPLGTWPALLLIGLVWGLWHAPLILLGYNFGRPDLTGLAFMVGGCIALSVLFGWLRLRTGSLWPAVFAHAALNASSGMLLALVLSADSPTPDMALVTVLGVSGWLVSAVVVLVLVLTGQFRRQPEVDVKPPRRNSAPAEE